MSAIQRLIRLRRSREEVLPEVARRKTQRITRDERDGKLRKVLLGIVLWPVCLIALITLGEMFFREAVKGSLWKDASVWFFTAGCISWFILSLFRVMPVLTYVFAHELTHIIATWLSGGRVHRWDVTQEGGFVEASKTNWFITLSPYLVPFYTLVVFGLYGLISLLLDLHQSHTVSLGIMTVQIKLAWVFHFLMGLTWAFHIFFTFDVLKTEQSDLLHNGEFFSIMLIFGWNLALLGLLFITASSSFSWRDPWRDASHLVSSIWRVLSWFWHLV